MIPYFALFSWPLFTAVFFRQYSAPLAILVTIVAGYLLLPEHADVDLPVLPALNKFTIPVLTALAIVALGAGKRATGATILPGWLPKSRAVLFCFVFLVGGSFATAMTNSDTIRYGPTILPGIRPYDAMSMILDTIMIVLPLVLARKFLATAEGHQLILKTLCVAGLVYSLFILVELRMSPQFHNWVYGYFPHVWGQHARGGGWRPVVFLRHGLMVGIFLSAAVLAAFGLSRCLPEQRGRYLLAGFWLLIVLVLSKNLGALLITVVLLPVVLFTGRRMQLVAAGCIALAFLSYPVIRDTQVVPLDRVVSMAEGIDPQRAASLLIRLENEDNFLDKVDERPLFGWGGWGRSRMYSSDTGRDETIADGEWIITLSVVGWTGYIGLFGLVCTPLVLLLAKHRRIDIAPETAVLALILAGNIVDLIPNSSLTPLSWLVVGALWGRLELASQTTDTAQSAAPAEDQAREPQAAVTAYTRQTKYIEHKRALR